MSVGLELAVEKEGPGPVHEHELLRADTKAAPLDEML